MGSMVALAIQKAEEPKTRKKDEGDIIGTMNNRVVEWMNKESEG